jgi:hypothetical protein
MATHVLMRLTPLAGRALHRLRASPHVERAASRSWTLSPAAESISPPSQFDESDLSKLEKDYEDLAVVRGGRTTHYATRVHELRNAVIANGHLFTPSFYFPMGSRRAPLWARPPTPRRHYADALLCTSTYSATVFGHWIHDSLPLVQLAREMGVTPVSSGHELTRNQQEWLELLDLRHDHVLDATFDRLLFVEDVGHTESKLARYHALRARGAARRDPLRGAKRGVYIHRGATGNPRVLVNEDELADIARSRGLDVIRMDAGPSSQHILDVCFDTPLVIGNEGSHLVNAFPWMSPRATMLALFPPFHFVLILKGMCDALGATFSFIVGDAAGTLAYRVNPDVFARRLDLHLAQTAETTDTTDTAEIERAR